MKARLTLLATIALSTWLLYAVPALAHDNGEGLVGETDDKIITFFSLGVVVFFAVFVTVASWIQSTLDRRKEQRKAADLKQRIGW
jgi:Kef-type K+ transport system membrane component KefB